MEWLPHASELDHASASSMSLVAILPSSTSSSLEGIASTVNDQELSISSPQQLLKTPQSQRSRASSFSQSVPPIVTTLFRTPSRVSNTSLSPSSPCCSSTSSSGSKDGELCAVCLNPLRSKTLSITRTSCQHAFHACCLQEVKQQCRSECPLCRSVLSPVAFLRYGDNNANYENVDSFSSSMIQHNMRGAVIAAAARGREAVRRAMMMRAMNNAATNGNSLVTVNS